MAPTNSIPHQYTTKTAKQPTHQQYDIPDNMQMEEERNDNIHYQREKPTDRKVTNYDQKSCTSRGDRFGWNYEQKVYPNDGEIEIRHFNTVNSNEASSSADQEKKYK